RLSRARLGQGARAARLGAALGPRPGAGADRRVARRPPRGRRSSSADACADRGARVTRALVTGVTGQDGYLLAEQLLREGVEVYGLARRADADVPAGTRVLVGDLLDDDSLRAAVAEAQPDELYHLAAPTYVPDSFEEPGRTLREVAGATEVLLEAAPARIFVASGVGRTVRELVEVAFAHAGIDPTSCVRIDPQFTRGVEAVPLVGDPSKARSVLGWEPQVSFEELIGEMVDHDLARLA